MAVKDETASGGKGETPTRRAVLAAGIAGLVASYSYGEANGQARQIEGASPEGASGDALFISNATIIDGKGGPVIPRGSVLIRQGRIVSVGRSDESAPPGVQRVDALGKYLIPGLMNANVHLCYGMTIERLGEDMYRFDDLITEAAQLALKGGLTTVFDTWGPRRYLLEVRDRVAKGEITASRFFCAGNIIGLDGPYSDDFNKKGKDVLSPETVKRINSLWAENVGNHLLWHSPDEVAREVRSYIARGIDFVKYASNSHPGISIAFSAETQRAIVDEAHRAGIPASAHCTSVEGLRLAVEAGCDLIQHCNLTGPVPIPESTLETMVKRRTGAVIFLRTMAAADRQQKESRDSDDVNSTVWQSAQINVRNLIRTGAPLLFANDAGQFPPELLAILHRQDESPLLNGHFAWLETMEKLDCPSMAMLQAVTRNIANAYGKGKDLGTIERGKAADMVLLEQDPLLAAENYRSISMVIKDGKIVNREVLPTNPVYTRPLPPPVEEERFYVPFLTDKS
jgi:imidazolonepropionase-like amidohydrolase